MQLTKYVCTPLHFWSQASNDAAYPSHKHGKIKFPLTNFWLSNKAWHWFNLLIKWVMLIILNAEQQTKSYPTSWGQSYESFYIIESSCQLYPLKEKKKIKFTAPNQHFYLYLLWRMWLKPTLTSCIYQQIYLSVHRWTLPHDWQRIFTISKARLLK